MNMLIEEFTQDRHNLQEINDLLSMAMGNPTSVNLRRLMDEFYTSDGHAIFVATNDNKVVCVIGMDYTDKPLGVITQITVLPENRKQGVGNYLINHVTAVLELTNIEAETDQDAVDFYNACGFKTKEIVSRYQGVRRFRCLKSIIK
ncbi:GNAT family N-acetyltransferase [Chloroflexota bacterium]